MNESSVSYEAARRRAQDLIVAAHRDTTLGSDTWDGVAIRDLIALALYAVGLRERHDVGKVPLGHIMPLMFRQSEYEQVIRSALTAAGHDLDFVDPADPVSAAWEWLQREWDPDAPPGQRWDGLCRGIAPLLPDPAIVICLQWAGGVVDRVLGAERGALDRRTRVRITTGDHAGRTGKVETSAWRVTSDGRAVELGPPVGYMVYLDEICSVEAVPATDLEPATEQSP